MFARVMWVVWRVRAFDKCKVQEVRENVILILDYSRLKHLLIAEENMKLFETYHSF